MKGQQCLFVLKKEDTGMFTLLTTIFLISLIVGVVSILVLLIFGLGVIAIWIIKMLMVIGLVYLGIKAICKVL